MHSTRIRAIAAVVVLAACSGGDNGVGPTGPAPATQLSLVTAPAGARSGIALTTQPSVRLRDATGLPVAQAGVVVTATSTAGVSLANATATTDASGIATFSGLALTGTVGSYAVTFTATGLTAVAAPAMALGAGPPSRLRVAVEPSASAQAGTALAIQPAIQLVDASGNDAAQASVTVTATLVSGGATLSNASAASNAQGVANFAGLTLSGAVGNYTLHFAATGLTAVDAAAATALLAGPPTQVALVTAPSTSVENGAVFTTQPVARLRDAFNNDATQAGVAIVGSIVTAPGAGGAIAGDSAVTAADGQATFTAMMITGAVGNYAVRFAATGLASIVAPVAVTPSAATRLGVTTQPPANPQSGVALATAPVVQVQDQSGNAVAQAGVVVHAALTTAGAVLANDSAATDATGKATFTGLRLTGATGIYVLQFTATGLANATAAPLALQPGAAAALAIGTQPAFTAQNAIALTRQPTVRIVDASGNAVSQANVVVTASVIGGGATLANGTATTGAGGLATFANLSVTAVVGSYTLRFSAPAVTGADASAPTVLSAGVATQLGLTDQPSVTASSGAALLAQPSVQLRDVSGNPVSQAGIVVAAGVLSGTVTFTNESATTTAGGLATFAGLALSGIAGSYDLRFSSGTLTPADAAAPLVLGPGAPATIAIVTPPPAQAVSGTPLSPPPVVRLFDAAGNPVPDFPVEAGASGAVTVTGHAETTNGSGFATFTGLTLTGTATGYSVRFCLPTCTTVVSLVTGAPSPTSLSAGSAATAGLVIAPAATAQSGVTLGVQPVVAVSDVSGNPVAGATVTATAAGAVIANGSAVTDQDGIATFAGMRLSGPPAGYTVSFASGAALVGAPVTLDVGPPATMTIGTAPSAMAVNGVVFATQPVVTVRDGTGNPISGATVAVTTGAGVVVNNGSAVTAGSGSAAFASLGLSGTVGLYTLTFASGAAQATADVTLTAGVATTIAITTQPPANAQNGIALTTQPVVRITDGLNGVPGVIVTASLPGGSVTGATATTDALGDAHFAGLTLSGVVGNYTLHVAAVGAGALQADAAAPTSLAAGAAATLMIVNQPSTTAASSAPLGSQPTVQVTDVGGNLILSAGTLITATLVGGGGSLANATATTDGGGLATFNGLAITALVGPRTLRFSGPGLQSATAAAPTVITPGAATQLALTTQPAKSSVIGQPLPVQPVVQVRDAAGNAVALAGTDVTASVVTGAPTLTGTPSTTDALGRAVFSGLGIVTPAGRYRLRFSAAGLAPATAADSTVVGTLLTSGVPVTNLSGGANSAQTYVIEVLPGDTQLSVTIGGQGSPGDDADLYVRLGDATNIPDDVHDCFPNLPGSVESCVIQAPAPGLWYISIYGFFSYSQLTLTATRQ